MTTSTDTPLWTPDTLNASQTHMHAFMDFMTERFALDDGDYEALWEFSIEDREVFWDTFRKFANLRASHWGDKICSNANQMPGAKWFPDARLNYAENMLNRRDEGEAMVFRGEDKVESRLSWAELYNQVSVLAQGMRREGIEPGDRVSGYMPNMPATIIAMLATSSIGAVWSSCSPDFGVQGVLDRFGQIEPKLVISVDGYFYNGKSHSMREKLTEVMAGLPSVSSLLIVPYTTETPDISTIPKAVLLDEFTEDFRPKDIEFEQLPFDHPLFIMYSSGTTGVPKCIVHGAGGTLIQHAKEHMLHSDIHPDDRVFYFTTCGWMMWNWLASVLGRGATLLLYDGSPFYPDGNVIWDYAQEERMTFFGTSAKYIDALAKSGIKPRETHNLKTLRAMASTGSPLAPESFDYVYNDIKQDIHLASIAGGTDIVSCFMLGNPAAPVYRGEIQCRGLGMAVDVFDDEGKPVRGDKGELVCTVPFPSMPVGFWNDEDGAKYHSAYFDRFDNIWCHGDYVELTANNGIVIYGRSDATLNPGGVRIGTAEIYRQVEQLDDVVEGIVIGQSWDNDVRVVLFVRLRDGVDLDDALQDTIRKQIKANCTPRHVPARIIQVADIPRTKSGKITELAVRDVVHGRTIKNKEALANPEALDLYVDLAELQD
ncbi:MAG: acetoacetate--CoA ligase [Rhodospirillales bacterium]|jgi:acetoacetyl-CoA synthetase|nr:acetoacetate--CoA ligase [Rhodospirillales bacterium]